jgi:hypothetical protein
MTNEKILSIEEGLNEKVKILKQMDNAQYYFILCEMVMDYENSYSQSGNLHNPEDTHFLNAGADTSTFDSIFKFLESQYMQMDSYLDNRTEDGSRPESIPDYLIPLTSRIASELYGKDIYFNTDEKKKMIYRIGKIIHEEKKHINYDVIDNDPYLRSHSDYTGNSKKLIKQLHDSLFRNQEAIASQDDLIVTKVWEGMTGEEDAREDVKAALVETLHDMNRLVSFEFFIEFLIKCESLVTDKRNGIHGLLERCGHSVYCNLVTQIREDAFMRLSPFYNDRFDMSYKKFSTTGSDPIYITSYMELYNGFSDEFLPISTDEAIPINSFAEDNKANREKIEKLPSTIHNRIESERYKLTTQLVPALTSSIINLKDKISKLMNRNDVSLMVCEYLDTYYRQYNTTTQYYEFPDGMSLRYTNIAVNQFERIWYS